MMDEIDDGEKMIFLRKAFRLQRKLLGVGSEVCSCGC
jgi:hypothetical protein